MSVCKYVRERARMRGACASMRLYQAITKVKQLRAASVMYEWTLVRGLHIEHPEQNIIFQRLFRERISRLSATNSSPPARLFSLGIKNCYYLWWGECTFLDKTDLDFIVYQ